jgi:Glycosyl transferase family 2
MATVTIGFVPRDRFCKAAEALGRIFECTQTSFNLILVDCNIPPLFRQQMDKVLRGRENVKVIRVDHYLTSNASRNLAVQACSDDFICLIENDVLVEEGWLSHLVSACEDHPADVAVPLLLEPYGFSDKVHFDTRLGRIKEYDESNDVKFEIIPRGSPLEVDRNADRHSVDFIEMHCILFRRNVFLRIGLFDETLSGSRAEVDISMALHNSRIPIVLEPKSRVVFSPPPPIYPEEKDYYLEYWDLSHAVQDHDIIKNRWKLVDCPSAIGFVKARIQLAKEPDPGIQVNRHNENVSRLLSATREISSVIPSGERLILLDDAEWLADDIAGDRTSIRLIERNGQYLGSPPDNDTAIGELERLRLSGASFLVIGWPAFWMFDHYREFHEFLRSRFRCIMSNDRVVIFDLRSQDGHVTSRQHQFS